MNDRMACGDDSRNLIVLALRTITGRGEAPTIRALCFETGLRSTSTVCSHLKILVQRRMVKHLKTERGHIYLPVDFCLNEEHKGEPCSAHSD